MLAIAVLILTLLVLLMVFINPKNGPIFIWPTLFLYPHYLMYRAALLPLNIGVDDLFICVFFLIVLFRQNILGGIRPKFGTPFVLAFVFILVLMSSEINGYFLVHEDGTEFAKRALKGFITLLLVYSISNTIDSASDVKKVVFSYCFFAGAGAVLLIIQNYFPGPMKIFSSGTEVQKTWLTGVQARPSGAFLNPNNAAVVMGVASLITISTLSIYSNWYAKWMRFGVLVTSLLAILLTRSRSGFICLVIPLGMMAFFGRSKKYAWLILVTGIIVLITLPGIRGALFERFSGGATTPGVVAPVKVRYEEALGLWKTVTLRRLLLGQSELADVKLGKLAPHSDYLGVPLRHGIIGTIWTIYFFWFLYKMTRFTKKSANWDMIALASGIQWCFISFGLYAIIGGLFNNYYIRYTLFLLLAIMQSGYTIVASEYDQEQNSYSELYEMSY